MKKIKTAVLLILCLCLCPLFFACDRTVKVESIDLNVQEIVLRPGETHNVEATVGPNNATNKNIRFVLSDTSCASLTVDAENQYSATITANNIINGPKTTFLQAVSEDETVRSKTVKVTIYTDPITLYTPQNLVYNYDSHIISWDKIESASGYKISVQIEGDEPEEVLCATNNLQIDAFYHKVISVKVKAVGDGEVYLDSEWSSETFKFIQPEEPKNLRNDGKYIKFTKVENAKHYNLFVYDKSLISGDVLPTTAHYTYLIDDLTYNEETGYYLNLLENNDGSFIVKVQTIAKDFEGVVKYPSKSENSITITKIAKPLVNSSDFKFTYSNKTLSWKSLPYATKYVITRTGVENDTVELDANTNYYVLDTEDNKLKAGVYYYSLKIIGNNKEYLDSNTSDSIEITKLASPILQVKNGVVAWNAIEKIGGYSLKIDDNAFTHIASNKTTFELNSSFIPKQYNFKIKAEGNGTNTLTSEESAVLTASKLKAPEKPTLENNKTLVFNGTSFVNMYKIVLTRNGAALPEIIKNNLTEIVDGEDIIKQATIDVSKQDYSSGRYNVYAVAYADGYLYSEKSETYYFDKLEETNTLQLNEGVLSYNINSIEGAKEAEVYIEGNAVHKDVSLYDFTNYNFEANTEYSIQLRYYPEANTDLVISNFSTPFTIEKLQAPDKLYVEEGLIQFSTQNSFNNKFLVKPLNSIEKHIYSNVNSIKLQEGVVYEIIMYHEGDSQQYLTSNNSNKIFVQLLDYVGDLKLTGDTLSFTDIFASEYTLNVVTKEGASKTYPTKLENTTSYSLKDLITKNEQLNAALDYNALINPINVYVSYVGGTMEFPENIDYTTIAPAYVSRYAYTNNLDDISNVLTLKILPTPTNIRTTELVDFIDTTDIDINELYFDCLNGANMFEFTYTNTKTSEVLTKILTTDNYLTIHNVSQGNITYLVDTSFLDSGKYNFTLRSIAASKVDTNPSNGQLTYNINSFDTINLKSVVKLKQVESLSCENGKIIIHDNDTSDTDGDNGGYIYLLTINGKTIYDDILEKDETLEDVLNEALSSINGISLNTLDELDAVFAKIKKFQSKTRTLKDNYTGTFNVNCYKIEVPLKHGIGLGNIGDILKLLSDPSGLMSFVKSQFGTGNTLKSELTTPIVVSRLKEVAPVLKNGFIEFSAIENATSYDIHLASYNGEEYVYETTPVTIQAGSTLVYNVTNHFNGQANNYQFYVVANTNKNNYLASSGKTKLDFEILQAPTLKVSNGEIAWNAITNASGYKLEIYLNNQLFDTLNNLPSTVTTYDAMKKSDNETVVESGNYTFIITALGEIGKEESNVISSLKSAEFEATKLSTPSQVKIKNGKLILPNVDNHTGVSYYNLYVNKDKEVIGVFTTSELEYELPEKYLANVYTISYQALAGDTNYLTSNISTEIIAEKLNETSNIYIENGEIYWEGMTVENYKNSQDESVVYTVDVKREDTVKAFDTTTTAYILSADEEVEAGYNYKLYIKTIGDSYYYLNSNNKVLDNVAKLDYIKDFRIEDGKLVWTNPKVVSGTANYTKASPNGLNITFTKNGNKTSEVIANGVSEFVLDENYEAGTYYLEVFNIGNEGESEDGNNYINSKTIKYSRIIGNSQINSILKLNAPTNLNIKDGINLSWTDNNDYSNNQYIVNITQNIDNQQTHYTGVINADYAKIEFSTLSYYRVDSKNYLIANNDSRLEIRDGKTYFNEYEVFRIAYEGSFDVNIKAYGGDNYITSDSSNTINIILPDPVTDLKVEHGKVTWNAGPDANGFIITITRKFNDVDDIEFNLLNRIIYVSNQTHYNLPDVGYHYTISVSSYSLIDNETNQTMASEKVTIENYYFDSFTDGNGSKEKPYIIDSVDTLKLISYNNFAHYKLIVDIALTENFSPLFNNTLPFIGSLVGLKEDNTTPTIYGLSISDSNIYGGLLGYMSKSVLVDDRIVEKEIDGIITSVREVKETEYIANVENIIFQDVAIISGTFVGVVAGYSNGIIKNITVYGYINSASKPEVDTGASQYNIYSGSIVGRNEGTIENVTNYASIIPTASTGLITGGIAGANSGTIKYSANYANILGSIAGGIAGENIGTIESCTSRGNVTCSSYISNQSQLLAKAGGIAGSNGTEKLAQGNIINCLVDNDYFGTPAGQGGIINDTIGSELVVYIGGLVGENYANCYNNVVKTELYIRDNANGENSSSAGKIFGYNKDNSVEYNYCLEGALVHASTISGNGVDINSTNKELASLNSELVEILNNNNTDTNISWKYVNDKIVLELN